MYAIMKTMCSPGFHQNGVVPTPALRNMMYMMNHTSCAQVHELPKCIVAITGREHCIHDSIHIMLILYL